MASRSFGTVPDRKVHGANMAPNWGRQDPGGPMLATWTLLSGMPLPELKLIEWYMDHRENKSQWHLKQKQQSQKANEHENGVQNYGYFFVSMC